MSNEWQSASLTTAASGELAVPTNLLSQIIDRLNSIYNLLDHERRLATVSQKNLISLEEELNKYLGEIETSPEIKPFLQSIDKSQQISDAQEALRATIDSLGTAAELLKLDQNNKGIIMDRRQCCRDACKSIKSAIRHLEDIKSQL